MTDPTPAAPPATRRTFLQASAAAAGTALLPTAVHAGGSDTFKVALIGCGGRGTGAAANALRADPAVKLWAACDIFPDRIEPAPGQHPGRRRGQAWRPGPTCRPSGRFSGFDGYKQAVDSGADMVILATSPGFRPIHFAYAVEKSKHVFMEKPHAVDAAGARSVIATAKRAEEKKLGVCAGFTYRYDAAKRAVVGRIHDGAIGDVLALHTTFLTGDIWHRGNRPEWSEMEKQVRNWYYYTWLSGDFIVEQAIHNVDKACWIMNDQLPVAATGMGGREVRTDPKYGNIWDHFTVVYEYATGAKVFLQCRQTSNCQSGQLDQVFGSRGQSQVSAKGGPTVTPAGGATWTYPGPNPDPYDTEHAELIASIRAGKPLNDAVRSAHSTLMAILGREAAYTGQRVTWKQILESKQQLVPTEFAWGANPVPPVAVPGKTKFV